MAAAVRSSGPRETWRRLGPEQRAAGVASVLLLASTLGPFSFVEAATVLVGLGVLALLDSRADGRDFHLPFGDGTAIAAAGAWSGFLILVRIFDRPIGQSVLALVCAAILLLAGLRERAKRPPDDVTSERPPSPPPHAPPPAPEEAPTRRLTPGQSSKNA